jgi:hypothetical protein
MLNLVARNLKQRKNQEKQNKLFFKYYFLIFFSLFVCFKFINGEEKNVQFVCKTDAISKEFTFLYIPSRNRVIWLQEAREMKINKKDKDLIFFTGYGVYGLGYDSWFKSNLSFNINLKSGDFKLTPENIEHRNNPQIGKCFNKTN